MREGSEQEMASRAGMRRASKEVIISSFLGCLREDAEVNRTYSFLKKHEGKGK